MHTHRSRWSNLFTFSLVYALVIGTQFSPFNSVTAQAAVFETRSDSSSLIVTNLTEEVNGDYSSPATLIANPGMDGISLLEAIAAANNGSDYITISFDPLLSGSTLTLTHDMPHITRGSVTINGDINEDGTPDITIDGTDADYCGFNITGASNVVIRGFNLHNFPKHGIYIQPDSGSGKADIENIVVYQNDITAVEGAISLMIYQQSGASISNVEISSNTLHDSPGGAISIHAGMGENSNYNQISNVSIISNRIDNPSVTIDIMISPASSSNISNNTISNIMILDNYITSYNDSSILVDASNETHCNNNTLDGLLIAGNTIEGITVVIELVTESNAYSTGNLMTNVTISDNVLLGGGIHVAGATGYNANNNTTSNFIFERNVINANSVSATANGIYITAGSGGAYNNTLQTVLLRDNLIIGFRDTGILVRGDYSTSPNNTIDNVNILNQTLINNGLSSSWSAGGINVDTKDSSNAITNVTIMNSIFWGNNLGDAIGGNTTPGLVAYNLINDPRFTGSDDNFYSDPLFVDASSGDYHLQSSSPGVDAGDPTGANISDQDLEHNVRLVDGNDDLTAVVDLGPFEVASTAIQEISVSGNDVSILNNDSLPVTWDGTDFGDAIVGGSPIQNSFTIENEGAATLTLSGSPMVEIIGTHASDFSVVAQPDSTINGGQSTSFTIQFTPSDSGLRQASVQILNNDCDESEFTFAIHGYGEEPPDEQEIAVSGNGVAILDEDITPSTDNGTDFSDAVIGGSTIHNIFTIENTGDLSLELTGTNPIEITGTNAGDFTVISQPGSSISGGDSDTFTIEFSPQDAGIREATIRILSNDNDESEYTFAIQGDGNTPREISVSGNGLSIYDGDASPSTSDGTDFGYAVIGGETVESIFTITNTGDEPLELTGTGPITILGENAADFTVTSQPGSTTIYDGGSVSFSVEFSPQGTGARGAMVRILNNDSDEGQFSFTISGYGNEPPTEQEISVSGNGVSISDGDNTPSTLDGTDFGNATLGGSSVQVTFTIANLGESTLSLTGTPLVQISGTNADEFSISAQPDSSIDGGDSTTFTVTFSPTGTGNRLAQVNIPNNDADEGGFFLSIQGFGIESSGEWFDNFIPLFMFILN